MSDTSQAVYKDPDWVASCETCRAVWRRLISDDKFGYSIKLGSFQEALSTPCPHHQPLVKAFYECSKDLTENMMSRKLEIQLGTAGYIVYLDGTSDGYGFVWSLALIDQPSIPRHPGTVRTLHPEWADLGVLNTWKNTCLSSHGALCHNPLKIWQTRPAWLIDTRKKCLVPGNVQGDYVALSYTYGNHVGRLIDTNALAKLQVPQALESPALTEYVSPIIRNAIYLTAFIGERYLWADALCVTHESPESTTKQLTLMGAIYANAILTIVAADGDSLTGLAGINGVSAPRKLEQRIVPLGDEKLLRRENFEFEAEANKSYYERGWIYQELRLSPRKIVVSKEQLHWQCQCNVWHEEAASRVQVDVDACVQETMDTSLGLLWAGFFDWCAFGLLVPRYSELTFRYEEDAFPAISGLLSVLSRRFEGGFLYGIPEMMFERGLGWRAGLSNLKRRVRSSRPRDMQLKPSGLPSWSWIGWKGCICMEYNEATMVTMVDETEETTSVTKWYTSSSPTDPPSQWRRIRSTWYEKRDGYKDLSKPLPPGWSRHEAPETSFPDGGPRLFPDGCDKYVFKHESAIGYERKNMWYYPFPVPGIDESTFPDMPEQTEYLFCETSKAQLWGVQRDGVWKDALLYNNRGQETGFLNLVNDEFLARFPKSTSNNESGYPVDLVAVCKIRKYSRTKDDSTQIWEQTVTKKDVYLVLWVEWKEGIAYRLASGQVQVEKWDELELETISLILG